MKKTEVETVKAYARRQVDHARPAFGRYVKHQPRHSIEFGSTNSSEYLHSQTGNRSFWGMKVLKAIDLDKLKADRLQLWGEAAHYQRQGEALTINEALWSAAGTEQEKRRAKDPWEATLANMPVEVEKPYWDDTWKQHRSIAHRIIHVVDDQERVASADLLTHVLDLPIGQQTTAHWMRLANVMKALGWERDGENKVTINDQQVRGYFRWIE